MAVLDTTSTTTTLSAAPQANKSANRVWRAFRGNRRAWFGAITITIIALAALFAPMLAKHAPQTIDMLAFQQPPNSNHILGTDSVGRDVFSRLLYGARVSLVVSLVAVTINVTVGSILGAIAGYIGGAPDQIIMRISDSILAFPLLILVIVAVAIWGSSLSNLVIVIGLMSWPSTARIVRGQVLSIRNEDYVAAATTSGASRARIIRAHILPNTLAPIIVIATFDAASIVLLEGSLSFLGLGVQPPMPSWGNMLSDAQSLVILESMPWLWLPPGLAIALTVLSLNFLGDALREAFDPTTHR
ncbi:MAG: ABC transporter permease [Thermomicrobiales bacterium]|nr:ABC transporter permease [Thermomicrobiales bacterium]